MAIKLEKIRNYFLITDTVEGMILEYPAREARYVQETNYYRFTSINDSTINLHYVFSELADENGLPWTDEATLTEWLRRNTGSDIPAGGMDVNVQDQTTPAIIANMSLVESETTLAVATAIEDRIISVVDSTGFTIGQYFSLFDVISNRFYVAHVLAVNINDITLDTPLDFAYPIGSFATGGTGNMNVDGSITPVAFGLRNTDQAIGTTMDITRMIFHCNTTGVVDLSKFGDIIGELTNGIVLRKKDGVYRNIFNIKTNGELKGIMYDLSIEAATNPNQGQNGFVGRLTFSGQNKIGVAVRIAAGEDVQMIIQDDLTQLLLFEVVVEGHEVYD